MSNPILSKLEKDISNGYASMPESKGYDNLTVQPTPITLDGIILKVATLFGLTLLTTIFGYNNPNNALMMVGIFAALILAVVMAIKPFSAKILAPLYALLQGYVLGSISVIYEAQYDGIVRQALGLTLAIFASLLFLYSRRLLKVTARARAVVTTATLGIFLYYLISIGASFIFNYTMPLIWSASPLGIAFSVFVAGLASYNFLLDFDSIEKALEMKADQRYEWSLSVGVLATFIWLYIELLRLLSKLRR
ncbi:MAG: Bax inhibitor-1/YccA family protein [Candidatus Paceibacterota bacterium]